mmetsp:Transcript_46933/g.115044  ORF Transcript_46933/g.115044 Transcript_46933/m.115044 type:complete len:220 (-) Transcript_46933:43-702(-)
MVAAAAAHADEDHDRDAHDVQHCNMQVVNVSTPAQYFHVLRRQVHRRFRKPLVVFAPKSLLKHRHAVSTLDDFCATRRFQPVLGDAHTRDAADRVRRIVLCTGKLYYDLAKARRDAGADRRVALVRIEQLSPYPAAAVRAVLERYAHVRDVRWVQEEPQNQGAYQHVALRYAHPHNAPLAYVGSPPLSPSATGIGTVHREQHADTIARGVRVPDDAGDA